MKRPLLFAAIAFSIVVCSTVSIAQIPRLLSYQGILTDTLGTSKSDGSYTVTFRLYDGASGGSALWAEAKTLQTKSGLFSTVLGDQVVIPPSLKFDKPYWLSIQIAAQPELSPRVLLTAVGYSLNAGAADTAKYALSAPLQSAVDSARAAGLAYGLKLPAYLAANSTSYGLEVDNSAGTGDGVRGYSGATAYNYAGVYAVNGGGASAGDGGSGVYGFSANGYGGYFESSNYRGLYVKGHNNWYAAYIENPGGSANVGLYVNGTMWVTGAKTGYVVDLAINDGPDPLEAGDVVVVTGYDQPVTGERIPLVKAMKAQNAQSSAVVGVVDQHYVVEIPAPQEGPTVQESPYKKDPAQKGKPSNSGSLARARDHERLPRPANAAEMLQNGNSIGTGKYFTMVTLGSFIAIKVDASFGAIQPGDLLVSSPNPGYAMHAESPKPGTVIGKALGSLAAGTGRIPVMVTLH